MKITPNIGAGQRVIYMVIGLALAALPLYRPMSGMRTAFAVLLGLATLAAGATGF